MALNPHQKNKIDIGSLSPEEQRLFRLYGKLPSRSDHFAKHLKERKYFDSGDYAMSKAGKGDGVDTGSVGSQHPVPEKIPHLSSPSAPGTVHGHALGGVGANGPVGAGVGGITLGIPGGPPHHLQAGSPVKESSFLHRETSASDLDNNDRVGNNNSSNNNSNNNAVPGGPKPATSSGQARIEAIPIRR